MHALSRLPLILAAALAWGCSDAAAGGVAAGSMAAAAAGVSGASVAGSGALPSGGVGGSLAGAAGAAGTPSAPAGAGGASGAPAGGSSGSSGVTLCGEPSAPEPEPSVAPDAVAVDASAKTTLKSGNFDEAGTNVLAPSAAAGFAQGSRNNTALWQWAESGAFLEYTVEATKAGSYSVVVMYYSAEPDAIATISVDGAAVGVVRFGQRDLVGEYGGIPGCCSRGHGVMTNLAAGTHQLRVSVSPRSVPLDVYGLQVNFAGQELANGGKLHVLPESTSLMALPSDGVADFYRMNYDAAKQGWPCEKSFCRVEYLVQPEQAGRYEVSLHYVKTNQQCMGVGFQLEDASVAVFKLEQAAEVTAPVVMDLPCGVSRISIRDPNYVDGEFCSFGATFGSVDLKRVP